MADFKIDSQTLEVTNTQPAEVVDWGVNIVQAPLLWKLTQGEGIKVAVLDTGADLHHPDLSANIVKSINFTTNNTADAVDRQGHGTHTAGIVAAIDNNVGVVGVAPKAQLYVAKVLGDDGTGDIAGIIKGIDWAIQEKVDIISMSLGASSDPGAPLHNAIKRARAAGIIIVAASGNEGTRCGWPAAYDECIAVGAVDPGFVKAPWSNYSEEVDVAAPGVNILSTYLNGQYARLSGTSMATPIISGIIALIQSFARKNNVRATPEVILQMIERGSVDLGAEGKDNDYGFGMLNVYKMVKNYNSNPK